MGSDADPVDELTARRSTSEVAHGTSCAIGDVQEQEVAEYDCEPHDLDHAAIEACLPGHAHPGSPIEHAFAAHLETKIRAWLQSSADPPRPIVQNLRERAAIVQLREIDMLKS